MIAFLFPGQGSQKVGMGKALAEAYPEARAAFEEADAAFVDDDRPSTPLSTLCFEGPEDRLTLTEITQPAILAVSVAACRVLEARGVCPALVAGHSLGEYSANVSAGTFTFRDAVRVVRRRGRYMQEAVPVGVGAMAAILGASLDTVRQACEEAADGEIVSPANINGQGQGARREARGPSSGQCAVPLRTHEACRGAAGARAARVDRAGSSRADCGQCRREIADGRAVGHRRAGAAGVGPCAMGIGRALPCVAGRHHVC